MESLKNITEKFEKIENNLNLWDIEEKGLYLWPYFRFSIYTQLLTKIGIYQDAHPILRVSKIKKIFRLIKRLFSKSIKNDAFIKGNDCKAILVLEHPRRIIGENDILIDPYSDKISQKYIDNGYKVLKIERPYENNFSNIEGKAKYNLNSIFLIFCMFKTSISKKNAKLLNDFSFSLQKEFNCYFDITIMFKKYLTKQYAEYLVFKKLFKKVSFEKAYSVIYYSHPGFIHACNSSKVPVCEIQHGTIYDTHLGYRIEETFKHKKALPNTISLLGNKWLHFLRMPDFVQTNLLEDNIFKNSIRSIYTKVRLNKEILFISQGTIGKDMFEYAKKLANSLRDYQISFKLHPSEKTEDYIFSSDNLNIYKRNASLQELQKRCLLQVGVYSTALLEGVSAGIKTILLDLPGSEHFYSLVDKKMFYFANDVDLLISIIKSNSSYQCVCEEGWF